MKKVTCKMLIVFSTMLIFSSAVSANTTLLKEEKVFDVTIESKPQTTGNQAFAVVRFHDPEKKVTCYITSAGSISCLQTGETPLSSFRQSLEEAKERAVANPTPENMSAYKKLEDEARSKAVAFTNAMHKAGFVDYAREIPQPVRELIGRE